MGRSLQQLWKDRKAQDLIEYALLCALVCTGSAVLIPSAVFGSMSQIYSRVNSLLIRFGGGGG
jgi:Flp pilus assembly pilin Flp